MILHPLAPALPLPAKARLILLSFLVLFVELALIRWTGSNILYLSFFTNFVLLGSFLGIGIGFLRGQALVNLFPYAPIALAALIGFVVVFPVQVDRSGGDLIFFGEIDPTGLPPWISLPVIFVAVAAVMALLAEGLARQFVLFEPLEAYRLDILGSILGILGFSALSFMGAPPIAWGAAVAVLLFILLPPNIRVVHVIAIFALVVMLGLESISPGYSWSPYYRIWTADVGNGVHAVQVNGIPHQTIWSTDDFVEADPLYAVPYERMRQAPGEVLIVGAGTGNDVALALQSGTRHIDAVEIDPGLQDLGADLHPDRPYQDPRVAIHLTDGRAFLEHTDRTYDLILFALPDSLTLVSGQSSVRLESYLFTLEALEAAREHLRPDGVFSMYNYYREDWLVDRLAGTLETAFGRAPCVDIVGGRSSQAVLTVGNSDDVVQCPHPWERTSDVVPPSRDDQPFLYLREQQVPASYLLTLGLILVASVVLVRLTGAPFRQMKGYGDLFFMGSAFLLLETKSVVQFALLFGTTWFVNALVFVGVLVSVYLAIEVARRISLPPSWVLYAVLVSTVLAAILVPIDALLGLSYGLRFGAAVALWFTPIFVANLVFAQRFKDVGASNIAFGANLLGAVLGGAMEYAALITGYTALAVLVAVLYGAAFLLGREHISRTARDLALT